MATNEQGASPKPIVLVPLRLAQIAALGMAFLVSGAGAFADDGVWHQEEQFRPILLGATGGNVEDRTKLRCCSGTLGALVTDGTNEFILSNNHVLALTNLGLPGDPIIHPGMIDQDNSDGDRVCTQDTTDTVATLDSFVPISFDKGAQNTVDAAIALTDAGSVSPDILDIGAVGLTIEPAVVGLAVMKSGRTTGLTFGDVSAVDVTVDVGYSKECGKGRQIARFVGQIRMTPGSFSDGGDSGSLIVQDAAIDPRPVGLLFAGSSSSTLANPMSEVLGCLGIAMAGGSVDTSLACNHVAGAGGDDGGDDGKGPPPGKGPKKKSSTQVPPGLAIASEVKARHSEELMAIRGVVGTGLSIDNAGNPVIEVYLRGAMRDAERGIPADIEGIRVRVVITGAFTAF